MTDPLTEHTCTSDRHTLARSMQLHFIELVADLRQASTESDTAADGRGLRGDGRGGGENAGRRGAEDEMREVMVTGAVNEQSLIFKGPLIRAILEGRKTQTRRIISPRNSKFGSVNTRRFWPHADFDAPHPGTLIDGSGGEGEYFHVPCHCQPDGDYYTLAKPVPDCAYCKRYGWQGTRHRLYCRYEVGQRIWVRETWFPSFKRTKTSSGCVYRADDDGMHLNPGWKPRDGWRPSIHMPRWASRITLEITGIRVEHLQDITESDSISEGADAIENQDYDEYDPGDDRPHSFKAGFVALWESINGDGSFGANPWVWVIEFKRVTEGD